MNWNAVRIVTLSGSIVCEWSHGLLEVNDICFKVTSPDEPIGDPIHLIEYGLAGIPYPDDCTVCPDIVDTIKGFFHVEVIE